MAFSNFTYPDVIGRLGLTRATAPNLFADVPAVAQTPGFEGPLAAGVALASTAHTEFSRAVWMVGPVLSDLWSRYAGQLTLIAGAELVADPAAGLTGYVDFVIGRAPHSSHLQAPVVVIFEAKRDSIPDALGQAIAGMVGAQRFNAREGTAADPVWGCCTTGTAWRFLRLSGTTVTLDLAEYTIRDVDKLLGILTHMVGPPPA